MDCDRDATSPGLMEPFWLATIVVVFTFAAGPSRRCGGGGVRGGIRDAIPVVHVRRGDRDRLDRGSHPGASRATASVAAIVLLAAVAAARAARYPTQTMAALTTR